jgi:hypothetical protein
VNKRRYLNGRRAWWRVKEGSSWAEGFQPARCVCMQRPCISHNTISEVHSCEILSHKLPDSYLCIIEIESEVEVLDLNMNLNMLDRLLTKVEEVVVDIHARSLANSGLVHRHSNSGPKSDVSSPQLHNSPSCQGLCANAE